MIQRIYLQGFQKWTIKVNEYAHPQAQRAMNVQWENVLEPTDGNALFYYIVIGDILYQFRNKTTNKVESRPRT